MNKTDPDNDSRRQFVKVCTTAAAAVAASPSLLAQASAPVRRYQRTRLVDSNGKPIKAASLTSGETYVFKYPFTETPCFLIDLGKPVAAAAKLDTVDGASYSWSGGVGKNRSLVAFSAICSHKLSHPARTISFINYQHQKVNFSDKNFKQQQKSQVIFCCSERSVYDPAQGARVLGGPAPQPLAAIALEVDSESDEIFATGTHGGEMFDAFFAKFGPRLMLEQGSSDVRVETGSVTELSTINEYSNALRSCG